MIAISIMKLNNNMIKKITITVVVLLMLVLIGFKLNTNSSVCKNSDNKIYEYKSNEEATDADIFYLVFNCSNNKIQGTILGVESEGEHGLLYYKEALSALSLDNKNISFNVGEKDLFSSPFNLTNYKSDSGNPSVGVDRNTESYQGIIMDNSIELFCKSDFYGCYSDELKFVLK